MENLRKLSTIILIALVGISVFSCKNNNEINPIWTPSQILSSTAWETTAAKNEKGENVSLTHPEVVGSVGFAYFKPNGNFTIFSLEDAPRIQGDWTVSPDGKTRTLVAKNASGYPLFTRVVEITVLNTKEFTYRIYPNGENDKSVYFDIIHTPTTHPEPKFSFTPSQILSSTAWETTAAKNEKNESIALADNAVSGNVGFAYFRPNGTFSIYTLQDSPRIQGDWSVSPDGSTRTLIAKDLNGNILFTRVVEITVLTTQEFTYRVYPNGDNDKSAYYDIIHTPTTHAEPAINTKS